MVLIIKIQHCLACLGMSVNNDWCQQLSHSVIWVAFMSDEVDNGAGLFGEWLSVNLLWWMQQAETPSISGVRFIHQLTCTLEREGLTDWTIHWAILIIQAIYSPSTGCSLIKLIIIQPLTNVFSFQTKQHPYHKKSGQHWILISICVHISNKHITHDIHDHQYGGV